MDKHYCIESNYRSCAFDVHHWSLILPDCHSSLYVLSCEQITAEPLNFLTTQEPTRHNYFKTFFY